MAFSLGTAEFAVALHGFDSVMTKIFNLEAGLAGLAQPLIAFAEQAEASRSAISNFLGGSTQAADKLLNSLRDFAEVTPFNYSELRDITQQMLAYEIAVDDVIPTINLLGEAAAKTGQSVNRLAYLYTQSMIEGRAYSRDIRQWTSAGIPMIKLLADQLGIAQSEVSKLATEGKIHFAELHNALLSWNKGAAEGTGLMEKQSQTIIGLKSNLGDIWERTKTGMGEALVNALGFKDILRQLLTISERLRPALITLTKIVGRLLGPPLQLLLWLVDKLAVGFMYLMYGIHRTYLEARRFFALITGNLDSVNAYTQSIKNLNQEYFGEKKKEKFGLPAGMTPTALDGSGKAARGPEFIGFAELAKRMQTEAFNRDKDQRTERLMSRTASASERLAKASSGDALNVRIKPNDSPSKPQLAWN